MITRNLLGAVLAMFGLATACNSSTSNPGGGDASTHGDSNIALSALPPKMATALCSAYQNCFGSLFSLFLNGVDCATLTEQRIKNGNFPRYQAEIDLGKLRYDGTQAQACLDLLGSLSCTELLDRERSQCLAALDGTVALGGDCELDEDCQGYAICKSSSGTCPGQCVPLLSTGQACSKDDDCQSGLLCSTDTKLCVMPASDGQTCEYGAPPCSLGLLCLGKNDTNKTSGTCKAPATAFSIAENGTCDPVAGNLCLTGLSCVADSVTTNPAGILWKCVTSGSYAAGATCKPAFPDACASGYYCKTGTGAQALSGTCTVLPAAQEPCGTGFSAKCRSGAVCVDTTCQNYAANGVTCVGDAMCYSERCGTSGGCESKAPCQ